MSRSRKATILILILFIGLQLSAQTDSIYIDKSFELSLKEDVLNLTPKRAFGSTSSVMLGVEEDNFTVTSPVYVLTREEMERSGVQSLAEAFRLIPGCLVREISKGNFDIAVSKTSYLQASNENYSNLSSHDLILLVNGIPILQRTGNYMWWESLPNISSIDQIEIVLSPSVAIHGISSAGPVINIVTRKMSLDKFKIVADGNIDNSSDYSASAYLESAITNELKMNLTADYRSISRTNNKYFVQSRNEYLTPNETRGYYKLVQQGNPQLVDFGKTNPNPDLSSRATNVQSLLEYNPNDALNLQLLLEYQNSSGQMPINNTSLLFVNERRNETRSATVFMNYKKLRLSTKYSSGTRNYAVGNDGLHYHNVNSLTKLDYEIKFNKLIFRPGVFFNYSDIESADVEKGLGIVPFIQTDFNSYGAFSVLDFHATKRLRLTWNGSLEHFSKINGTFFSSDLSAGLRISDKLFLRSTLGHSYQSPNIESFVVTNFATSTEVNFNKSLKPLDVSFVDIGLRAKMFSFLETEMNVFFRSYNHFQNQNLNLVEGFFRYDNNDLKLRNHGFTANVKVRFEKLHLRSFFTFLKHTSPSKTEGIRTDNQPSVWGGLSANYTAWLNRLNVNMLLYIYGPYDITFQGNLPAEQSPTTFAMKTRLVPYLKISYRLKNDSYIYLSAKNFLGKETVEYPFADYITAQFSAGIRFNFITK